MTDPRCGADRRSISVHRRRFAPTVARAASLAIVLGAVAGAGSAQAAPTAVPQEARGVASAPSTTQATAPGGRAGDWLWPVEPPLRVLSPYRRPPTPYAAGHRGVDLQATPGASVRAAGSGVVAFAGAVAGRPVLSIDHGGGVRSSIEPVVTDLPVGAAVERGAIVGVVGSGGHCDRACVHFGVRIDGEYVSPFLFLGGVPRAVLLPLAG